VENNRVSLKLNIGDIKHVQKSIPITTNNKVKLIVSSNNFIYNFSFMVDRIEYFLGSAQTRYLSSEVATGFTGVIIGLYAQNGVSKFKDFKLEYLDD
jgi:alpha-N-arabinofuranosidase